MLVTLIGRNSMNKIILPSTVEGSYWITDKSGQKLVNIEGKMGYWQIVSNDSAKIVNSQYINFQNDNMDISDIEKAVIKKIILKEYSMHCICLKNSEQVFILYCSPVYEKDIFHIDLKKSSEISIGRGDNNNILYNNKLIKDTYARIFSENGKWMIENYDTRYGTFINNEPIFDNVKSLENGDVIFIMGLKIIIIGSSIYVNNPQGKVMYNCSEFSLEEDNKNNLLNENIEDDEDDMKLYSDEDYFSRAPRIVDKIEREKIEIDGPPSQKEDNRMPAILTMGSSLSMGVMMVITMITTVDAYLDKTSTTKELVLKLIMSISMMIGMILIPIISRKYQKKLDKKYEKERQQKYRKYINSKIIRVNEIMEKQRGILTKNYVSAKECEQIVLSKDSRLWERKIEEQDFLSIRVGTGDVPLDIDVQYPRDSFSMADDELIKILNMIGQQSKILEDAPITVSLLNKNISAIITNKNFDINNYMKNIITQLVALHSYADLKLVFLLNKDNEKKWEYVKYLPHTWNETKSIRFFADDGNDIKQISKYLEDILVQRKEYSKDKYDYKSFMPYYLIITDNYKKLEGLKIISDILKIRTNLGFSMLCITDDLTQLPNECQCFINMDDENNGIVFENENSSTTQKRFKTEEKQSYDFYNITKIISNIPIKYTLSGSMSLPESYSFLEMYDVGRIEQLNIYERWLTNDSTISLGAPIGIDSSGMPIVLDAHEKFHGPHGLIAGSTGSGKSEFIITYILSLAINYHPNDVNFILIDYKGGGLAGAFEKNSIKLPHLVGTITNIDTVGLKRSLDSIQSELRKRQIMFNEAREKTDESTIDIYKYQKLYHDGVLDAPIPHLFIICDEFAELKQQQSDFMEELISVSRIGRSLGVHLILATQKPAGIVNDQIRSNSKFGVCLKVQSKSDSTDVIKRPDAATLKRAGQFYINVGNEEVFALGQSGWAGAKYYPQDIIKKEIDTSLEVISNIGATMKRVDNAKIKKVQSNGDQLTNLVKYIHRIAKEKGIKREKLWLDSIPENIYLDDLKEKYNYKINKKEVEVIIGEYDDPSNQRQGLLNLNLTNNGNLLIYGSADSGKETLLSTIIYNSIDLYSSQEVQFYIVDFGSEILKIYNKSPYVGDIAFINDEEKIERLIEMVQREINHRKAILAEYNGDYELYRKTTKKIIPMTVIIINNYSAFLENYEKHEEAIQSITRECIKFRIVFIITVTSQRDLRYRLTQNFKQKLTLQLNSDDEYFYIYDKIGKKRPSHLFGRGLVELKGNIYEFQTAKICESDNIQEKIKKQIETSRKENKIIAKPIPTMPKRVMLSNIKGYIKDFGNVPIGIAAKSLKVCTFNFKSNLINLIISRNIDDIQEYMQYFLRELTLYKNIDVYNFNTETENIDKLKEELIRLDKEKLNKNQKICIIAGIDKFIDSILQTKEIFESMLNEFQEKKNCSFIIMDNAARIKNHQYDNWYKKYVSGDNGIWIGDGLNDQYILNISDRRMIDNNCGNSFGYIVKKGNITLLKFLGLIESGSENG